MIEATLALSRSLGSIDSTVGSTTDKALRASWYFVKDYPLGEFIGSLWGVHVYARDFGKNEIALARATPFSEFLWADFLRRRMKRQAVETDFDHAIEKALQLAKSVDANYLPGWCGPVAEE